MSEAGKMKRFTLLDAVGILVVLVILFFIFQGITWTVHYYWNAFHAQWKEKPVQVVLTVFISSVALGLAIFKRLSLQLYALFEISFGFNFLWESTDKIIANPGNGTITLASAYVLARGFSNLFDSWKKKEDTRSDHPRLEERA